MANYILSTEIDKEYKEIEWGVLLVDEKRHLAHELQGIDRLTTRYEDSKKLKKFLINEGVLSNSKGKLCIIYKNKGQYKKITHGISYEKDRYFLDPERIKEYIKSKIKEKDITFIHKLINKYSDVPTHTNDIIILKNFIEKVSQNKVTEDDISYLIIIMERFVDKESYKYDNVNKRYKLDENGIRVLTYKNLRELGRTCSNYHYKQEESKEEVVDEKAKVKVNKKQCPGQLSFIN